MNISEKNAYVKYSDSLAVTVGLLSTYEAVRAKGIQIQMKSMLNVNISVGKIISIIRKCSEKVVPTVAIIRGRLELE